MALKWPLKDPAAVKDYSLDWSSALRTNEVIIESTWSVEPAGLSTGSPSILGAVTVVWLAGGTEDVTYRITNHITTDRGMVDERTVTIKVKNL